MADSRQWLRRSDAGADRQRRAHTVLFFPESGLRRTGPPGRTKRSGCWPFAAPSCHWRSSSPETPMNVRTFYVGALLVAGLMPLAAQLSRWPGFGRATQSEPALGGRCGSARRLAHAFPRPAADPIAAVRSRTAIRAALSWRHRTLHRRPSARCPAHVQRPTRQLHPAADCFKALGYSIDRPRPDVDAEGGQWSCFAAVA